MNKYALVLVTILFFTLYVAFIRNPQYVFVAPTAQPNAGSDQNQGSVATQTQRNQPTPTEPPPSNTQQPQPTQRPAQTGQYRDGTYTGDPADAYYGTIQVSALIQGGKITDVQFLQYPNDRQTSIEVNTQAMPYLKAEAIQAQNANVDIVSGATDSSYAFRQSLASALNQAH